LIQLFRSNKELWLALFTCLVLSGLYGVLVLWTRQILPAGGFYGHTIGVFGFLLMLSTEVLYSLRKRSRRARWGRMAEWLQLHIYTGIVGPFMVLLHASWKVNGLAGATLFLTGVIVISGFTGRYIYTRIPRTIDGLEDSSLTGTISTEALAKTRALLALWHTVHIPIGVALFTAALVHILGALYYSTFAR
jgi:hypothetical protein